MGSIRQNIGVTARAWRGAASGCLMLGLCGCATFDAQIGPTDPVQQSFESALRTLAERLPKTPTGGLNSGCGNSDRRLDLRIEGRGLVLQCQERGVVEIPFRERPMAGTFCDPIHDDDCHVSYCDVAVSVCGQMYMPSHDAALTVARAWHAIANRPVTGALEEPGFDTVASRYRATEPRPTIGEDVRRFSVQAEAAVRDKDLVAAALAYGDALQLAPWWPQGRFNRALVLGELGFHPEAIQEMQRYLQLVPDAANARQAQDKVYQWEAASKR